MVADKTKSQKTPDRKSGTHNGLHHAAMKVGEGTECGVRGGRVWKHGHGANGSGVKEMAHGLLAQLVKLR